MKKLIACNLSLILSITILAQSWNIYPYNPVGSKISFPADEGRHSSEPSEWWYTSGHLTGSSSGKHYSYMLSYFYNPISIFDGFRIFTLSDDENDVNLIKVIGFPPITIFLFGTKLGSAENPITLIRLTSFSSSLKVKGIAPVGVFVHKLVSLISEITGGVFIIK